MCGELLTLKLEGCSSHPFRGERDGWNLGMDVDSPEAPELRRSGREKRTLRQADDGSPIKPPGFRHRAIEGQGPIALDKCAATDSREEHGNSRCAENLLHMRACKHIPCKSAI